MIKKKTSPDFKNVLTALSIIACFINGISAQVPTFDPSQTVNPATGEMAFSIPLGTVSGSGGMNFPVNLNYKAGIRSRQQASPAGLGFSYEVGSITRKIVFAADDNIGGEENLTIESSEVTCKEPAWLEMLKLFELTYQVFSLAFDPSLGKMAGFLYAKSKTPFGGIVSSFSTGLYYSSINFNGGGVADVTPKYDYKTHLGKGMFEGGVNSDLADVYFVSTPYFSGSFSWIGDINDGNFVVSGIDGGVGGKEYQAIKIIRYYKEFEGLGRKTVFRITLKDGTKLVFDEISASPNSITTVARPVQEGDCQLIGDDPCSEQCACYGASKLDIKESTINKWHLTAVLPSTYVDGSTNPDNDPLNSEENNKGPWVAFEYKSENLTSHYRIYETQSSRISYSNIRSAGNSEDPIRQSYLKKIKTDISEAEFIYPKVSEKYDRDDCYWYSYEVLNGQEIGIVKEPEPRLDEIKFYTKGLLKRSVKFNQSYLLKQDWDSYNNEEFHSLTLDSVVVNSSTDSKALPPLVFKYDLIKNRALIGKPIGYAVIPDMYAHTGTISGCDDGCRHCVDADANDAWGYFYVNINTNRNDWNLDGEDSLSTGFDGWGGPQETADASTWSLTGVTMPNGMDISWEYSVNRYDRVNGISVRFDENGNSIRKFGGGIRVKKMHINGGAAETPITKTFIYTDQEGVFTENEMNSSGYASIEPFMHSQLVDYRPEKGRGGLYTPAVVAYSMVQVIDGYIEPDAEHPNGVAPNGYTVYKYTHCGDSTDHSNYHPNHGRYGEYDYQWRRGLLVYKGVYNSDGKEVSAQRNVYSFHNTYKMNTHKSNPVFNEKSIFDPYYTRLTRNTLGWVKLEKSEVVNNNLKQVNTTLYSSDLNVKEIDNRSFITKLCDKYYVKDSMSSCPEPPSYDYDYSKTVSCRTKIYGSDPDPEMNDYVIVRTYHDQKDIHICIGKDVGNGEQGTWTDWYSYTDENNKITDVIGAEVLQTNDGNNEYDLLVVTSRFSDVIERYMTVYVFHDVAVDGKNIVINQNTITRTDISLIDIPDDIEVYDYDFPVGCMINEFHGDPAKPDFLIFPNKFLPYWDGDCYYEAGRNILAITDFVENNNDKIERKIYKTTKKYSYLGNSGYIKEQNGKKNLVIAGVGRYTFQWSPFDDPHAPRKFVTQNFNGLSLNEESNTILFENNDTPCEDCLNGIFNAQPVSESDWETTQYSGIYYDQANDVEKVMFYSYYDSSSFLINDCYPVTVPVDFDGMPNRTFTRASNNDILLNVSTPAYWKYVSIGSIGNNLPQNSFSQMCGNVLYRFPENTSDDVLKGNMSLYSGNVVSANATYWEMIKTKKKIPVSNYNWREPCNLNGTTSKELVEFNYSNSVNNASSWKMIDSISRFSDNYIPLEKCYNSSTGKKVYSSIIVRNDLEQKIADAANARWTEAGVFTGDYENTGHPGFWDYENGWEKGSDQNVILTDGTVSHFGEKAIYAKNDYAASRNTRVFPGREYEMSAWVKVISGSISMAANYHSAKAGHGKDWPILFDDLDHKTELGVELSDPVTSEDCNGKWVLMKLRIPKIKTSKLLSGDTNFVRACIGNPPDGTPFEAYIDDIRIAPVDAQVTTMYYENVFNQPIVTVDQNNNPGQKVYYDSFGRPIRWAKIHPSKSANEEGYDITLQAKEYHLMGE